jgi:hypothetical protein
MNKFHDAELRNLTISVLSIDVCVCVYVCVWDTDSKLCSTPPCTAKFLKTIPVLPISISHLCIPQSDFRFASLSLCSPGPSWGHSWFPNCQIPKIILRSHLTQSWHRVNSDNHSFLTCILSFFASETPPPLGAHALFGCSLSLPSDCSNFSTRRWQGSCSPTLISLLFLLS